MADVSIVIVSYNTRELLLQCLASVLEGDLSAEIFVVDNASTDGTAEAIARSFPQVQLLRNAVNRGFAAANNQALRLSRGRYVLLLNPDTAVLDAAIAKLVAFMDARPETGAVGARLLNPDHSPQQGCFSFPNLWMTFFDFFPLNHRLLNSRLNGRYPATAYAQPFAIGHPLGACLMVRREAMAQVGLLDEDFFMYCEEIDWCLRLHKAGWTIYCLPTAQVVHYGGQSTRQMRQAMFVALHRSRYRLFRKHYSPAFYWAARAIVVLGVLREILRRWRQHRRGELERAEWEAWRRAYTAVAFDASTAP